MPRSVASAPGCLRSDLPAEGLAAIAAWRRRSASATSHLPDDVARTVAVLASKSSRITVTLIVDGGILRDCQRSIRVTRLSILQRQLRDHDA